jgi:hypothetical protein
MQIQLPQVRFRTDRSIVDANQQKALDWLAAPDSSENQNAARRKHQASTGAWFVDGQQFAAWKTKQKSLLWLHGIRKQIVNLLFPRLTNVIYSWLREDYNLVLFHPSTQLML